MKRIWVEEPNTTHIFTENIIDTTLTHTAQNAHLILATPTRTYHIMLDPATFATIARHVASLNNAATADLPFPPAPPQPIR